MDSRLLTPEQVAALCHCSRRTILRYAAGDRLPLLDSVKLGKMYRFRMEAVGEWWQRVEEQARRRARRVG